MPMCKTQTDCCFCWKPCVGMGAWASFASLGVCGCSTAHFETEAAYCCESQELQNEAWKSWKMHCGNMASVFATTALTALFFQLLLWCKVCFHICILERNSSWKKHIITNATCYIASVFLYERSRLHLESNVCQTTWLLNVSVANMQQSYPGAPRAGFTSY